MIKKVSIIVPIYNDEKYLKDCVHSVKEQSYDKWELILVDDGSTDASSSICDSLAQMDNRIKVFHQENSGVASARNLGLKNITGDLIAYLDSDDCIAPNYLEVLTSILEKEGADIVVGRCHKSEDMDYNVVSGGGG